MVTAMEVGLLSTQDSLTNGHAMVATEMVTPSVPDISLNVVMGNASARVLIV